MNLFIIAAVVLTGLAVAIVIRPLLRKSDDTPASLVAALVLGLALPAAVLVIYLFASNHDWSATAAATAPSRMGGDGKAGDLPEMVSKLEDRLRAEPGDVNGWLLLGRTYVQLQQIAESRRAYRQAMALDPSTEAILGVAEADILLDRSNLMRDAGRLVEEVLVTDPQNPKALFYGGMASMVRGDLDQFRDRWQRLLAMSPPEEIRAVIESQLAQVGVTAENISAPGQGIDVSVSVSEQLAERTKPGAVLYLVARDPNQPGPPLAAVRHVTEGFPVTLNISDANAMTPGRSLTSLPQVKLIARITNSGEPTAQAGDLFGESVWRSNEATGKSFSIVIDRVVE
ncbi:MAG: hypothetical protein QGH93_03505 [Gammaproteobacteria bacterium]|jgi:cytochrome c-type biogenesis protein CcmH|nr:hypothetical protein [Chromatiales bacterium]MDP6673905.1 hypothetical protein [Gammaproteobacteria bacterium]